MATSVEGRGANGIPYEDGPATTTRAQSGAGRLLLRTFSSFSNHDFLVLWSGMLASYLAMQMQQVARGYLAYDISGAATSLGVVTLASSVPMLLLLPIAGVVIDRVPKRNVLMATQAVAALTSLVNAILISMGTIEIWHLALIGAVQAGAFAFNMPARQAMISEIVGQEQLANAIAVNNAGMNLTRVMGPPIAGVLIGISFIGTAGAFYVMTACYVVVLVTLFRIPAQPPKPSQRGSMARELTAGMRYIWKDATLLTLVCMAFVPVLLAMPYQSLMPVIAKDAFGVGSQGLGLLMGAAGFGALVGSLLVAYWSESAGKGRLQLAAGVLFGLALVSLAAVPNLFLAVCMMMLVGAANNVYMALNNTLIMAHSDPSMHGRVMSVYMMTFTLMPVTLLPMSAAADAVGIRWTIAAAGGLTAAIIAIAAWAVPGFRKAT